MSRTNSRVTIVVDRPEDWRWNSDGLDVVAVDNFVGASESKAFGARRVINLCRRYKYLSAGYYCSLLAEARGQYPMPSVGDILSLSRKRLYSLVLPELDGVLEAIVRRLAEPPDADFTLTVLFGRGDDPRFHRLAANAFDNFRFPLMRLSVQRDRKRWRIAAVRPLGLHRVGAANAALFEDSLRAFVRAPRRRGHAPKPPHYTVGILQNPQEALPPSDADALQRFVRAGKAMRTEVEMITARDYARIQEFDALLIRETTALDHHTYQFACKAESEGIPVIDDPASILRCTNKVYLNELLAKHKLATPRTLAVNRIEFDDARIAAIEAHLGYPIVLKIPDGSFSRGVHKAENRAQLREFAEKLFARSRIILAQEFMYTRYDWRIGVLARKPLFACQYMMARKHWQIVDHRGDGSVGLGGFKTFAVEDAPGEVVDLATKAASLIGDGLYGVDLKQNDRGVFVIEINDNPNIDQGVEDKVLHGELYTRILGELLRRVDKQRSA